MRAALGDPDLFGRVFAGESWAAWRVLLIAAMGEALTKLERIVFESGGLCEVAGARVGRHGRRVRSPARGLGVTEGDLT